MRTILLVTIALAAIQPGAIAQPNRGGGVAAFISVSEPVVALVHVRIIDGTGAPAIEDQTIVIDHGKIATFGSAASTPIPSGARRMDLAGHTVIPGLVGMHEHLF